MEDEKLELKVDPLHEIHERFTIASEAWKDNRDRYKADTEFLAGSQWPDEVKKIREGKGQPCLVVDKLNQYVRQVVNDSRQNRPSIKIRPVDSDADVETADLLQGLCRHIEDRSDASAAYDTAIESAVKGGFGFIRILTEYANPDSMSINQEIAIERVRNPLAILIDPNCKKPDFSDMKYAFVLDEISCDEFERMYPNADEDAPDFSGDGIEWEVGDDNKLIAEYWEVVPKTRTLHLLQDGSTCTKEEYDLALAEGLMPPTILETRDIDSKVVMWSKVHGNGYIEKPREWIGKYIPIVPVIGNEIDIENKVSYIGLCHNALDAQRLYNYSRSAFAERVALAPKSPYVAASGQIENYPEWDDANSENYSVLRYDPVSIDGTVLGAPQRQPASDIPAGFSQDMQLSEHDIQSSLGMYAASLGQQSNEKSGKAIMARQREGDTSTFHFHDNLSRSIRHVGRILVDLIPKVYDSRRVVRILGPDGSSEMAQIDPSIPQATQKVGKQTIHNINVGTYDVTVTSGPSYTTRRQEAAEAMVQLTQANPSLMMVIGDLMVKNMDWPGADELAKRLQLMLPPEIKQAEQSNEEIPPEVMAVMNQAQQAIAQKDQSLQHAVEYIKQLQSDMEEMKAKVEGKQYDAAIKQAELSIKEQEAQIKAFAAETDRLQVTNQEFEQWKVQYEAEKELALARINAEKEIELAKLTGGQRMAEKAMDSMMPTVESVAIDTGIM